MTVDNTRSGAVVRTYTSTSRNPNSISWLPALRRISTECYLRALGIKVSYQGPFLSLAEIESPAISSRKRNLIRSCLASLRVTSVRLQKLPEKCSLILTRRPPLGLGMQLEVHQCQT